jgi:DNA-directed RNA polymerase specialized sigma24 family protein
MLSSIGSKSAEAVRKVLAGLSIAEIAASEGIAYRTAGQRVQQARRDLRDLLRR